MFIQVQTRSGLRCALRRWTMALGAAGLLWATARAGAPRPVEGIQDNSFLIEEAYNQEPGVVQHIGTAFFQRQRMPADDEQRLEVSFTQEWPLWGQTHQISYTVPAVLVWQGADRTGGPGDLMVHYRWQAWLQTRTLSAVAPRASLILPTGDAARGLGEDTLGFQCNLPFSTTLGRRWFVHANAGATILPEAASAGGRTLRHWNLGGSVIFAATSDLHAMLEWVGNGVESERPGGGMRHEFVSLISPGIRKAFELPGDGQCVLGVAVPLGLTRSSPEFGVFIYASLEHPFGLRR